MQDANKFEELLDQLMDAFPSLQDSVSALKEELAVAEESGEAPMEGEPGEEEGEEVLLGAPPMMPMKPKGPKPIPAELLDDEEDEEGVDVPTKIHGGY